MDIIGTMYKPTGEVQQTEDGEITVMTEITGWHVNMPNEVEGWEDKQVTPTTPFRVYAGHATFFYSFNNEEEFTNRAIEAGLIAAPIEMVED